MDIGQLKVKFACDDSKGLNLAWSTRVRRWNPSDGSTVAAMFKCDGMAASSRYLVMAALRNKHGWSHYSKALILTTPATLEKGSRYDMQESETQGSCWYEAKVLEKSATSMRIHYKGWGERYDETLTAQNIGRIAPLHTHTRTVPSGMSQPTR